MGDIPAKKINVNYRYGISRDFALGGNSDALP
jgi:hypothetical protein